MADSTDFRSGETIYDVDGNAYTVNCGRAVLNVDGSTVSYFLGRSMSACFSRDNPKPSRRTASN